MSQKNAATTAGARPGFRGPAIQPIDLDPVNRPGTPMERAPHPWPNSVPTPARMTAEPAVGRGRSRAEMPPVYGTSVPPRGLSGIVRRLAYRRPDHALGHWMLLLLADRVQAWGRRARRSLWLVLPVVALWVVTRRAARGRA